MFVNLHFSPESSSGTRQLNQIVQGTITMAITRVKVSERIAARADKVWEYIGAFNGLTKIMSGAVTNSEISQKGNIRRLKIAGLKKQLSERLIKLDDKNKIQSYSIIEEPNTPVPFFNYTATIKVKATSSRACLVEWSSIFEVKKGATKEECLAFAAGIYKTGIEGTRKAVSAPKKKTASKAKSAPKKKTASKAKSTLKKK